MITIITWIISPVSMDLYESGGIQSGVKICVIQQFCGVSILLLDTTDYVLINQLNTDFRQQQFSSFRQWERFSTTQSSLMLVMKIKM